MSHLIGMFLLELAYLALQLFRRVIDGYVHVTTRRLDANGLRLPLVERPSPFHIGHQLRRVLLAFGARVPQDFQVRVDGEEVVATSFRDVRELRVDVLLHRWRVVEMLRRDGDFNVRLTQNALLFFNILFDRFFGVDRHTHLRPPLEVPCLLLLLRLQAALRAVWVPAAHTARQRTSLCTHHQRRSTRHHPQRRTDKRDRGRCRAAVRGYWRRRLNVLNHRLLRQRG